MLSTPVVGRLTIFLLLLAAVPSMAQDSAAQIDQIVRSYVDAKTFMGSVLVARAGGIIINKGYGSANLEWNIANTPTTRFRLGSLTKQFTAACVLLLEERGKLSIDDPIGKHLTNSPATWGRITIRHLLTHTTGIPDFTGFRDYYPRVTLPTTVEELIQRFRDKPLEFVPDSRMKYSNSNYIVLGALIEKVGGKTFEQFLQENLLTPLGLKDTGYDSNWNIIPRRAAGYEQSPQGPINAQFIHMSIPHAAGAMYSTTEDLLRWERALFGGKVLKPASLRKMITPYKDNYALGLIVRSSNGRPSIGHGGGIEGFNTTLRYFPDDQLTIVVLANLNGGAFEEIAGKIDKAMHPH